MSSRGGTIQLACRGKKRCRRRVCILLAFFFAAAIASPLDWRSFAASTDSGSDTAFFDAFVLGDTEIRLALCEGIGLRSDPAEGAIIDFIADGHRGNAAWDAVVFLRALLASVFDPSQPDEALRNRVAANASALDALFSRVGEWRDPQLVEALVNLAPLCAGSVRLTALVEVGNGIVHALETGSGLLMPQSRSLAFAYLRSVREIADGAFLFSCSEIARLSRDKDIVDAARLAARTFQ
jgi:hypothetical protein